LDLTPFFDLALRSTADLPLKELLAEQGVTLEWTISTGSSDRGGLAGTKLPAERAVLGARTQADPLGVKLASVFDGGAAQAAGLSGGDVLIAFGGLKINDVDKTLARYRPGERVQVHAIRRDELITVTLELGKAAADTARLTLVGKAAWLTR
jgi:predicted metalloprotease with PDZ domain